MYALHVGREEGEEIYYMPEEEENVVFVASRVGFNWQDEERDEDS